MWYEFMWNLYMKWDYVKLFYVTKILKSVWSERYKLPSFLVLDHKSNDFVGNKILNAKFLPFVA